MKNDQLITPRWCRRPSKGKPQAELISHFVATQRSDRSLESLLWARQPFGCAARPGWHHLGCARKDSLRSRL